MLQAQLVFGAKVFCAVEIDATAETISHARLTLMLRDKYRIDKFFASSNGLSWEHYSRPKKKPQVSFAASYHDTGSH